MVRVEPAIAAMVLQLCEDHAPETAWYLKNEGISLEKTVRSLQQQLNPEAYDDTEDEGNLVDEIADILRNQWARNIISGPTLQALRDAILLPSERNQLAEAMRNFGCTGCGKRFVNGEMASFRSGSPPNIYCNRCASPTVMAACTYVGCLTMTEVPTNTMKVLVKRTDCGEHNKVEPAQVDSYAEPDSRLFSGDDRAARERIQWDIRRMTDQANRPLPAGRVLNAGPLPAATSVQWEMPTWHEDDDE